MLDQAYRCIWKPVGVTRDLLDCIGWESNVQLDLDDGGVGEYMIKGGVER